MKKLAFIFLFVCNSANAQVEFFVSNEQKTSSIKEQACGPNASSGVKIDCPDTVGLAHPTCHGAVNGYFRPDYGTFKTPIKRQLFILTETGWVALISLIWEEIGPCALSAGTYKWEVTDSLNIVHSYTATLTQPLAASVSIARSGNFNACTGVLTANVSGGVLPYMYKWSINNVSSSAITTISSTGSLCEVPVKLIVYEGANSFCGQGFSFHTGPVGLSEQSLNSVSIFPNPTDGQINFTSLPASANISIYTLTGELIIEYTNCNSEVTVDLRTFSSGLYLYQVKYREGILSGKLIMR